MPRTLLLDFDRSLPGDGDRLPVMNTLVLPRRFSRAVAEHGLGSVSPLLRIEWSDRDVEQLQGAVAEERTGIIGGAGSGRSAQECCRHLWLYLLLLTEREPEA